MISEMISENELNEWLEYDKPNIESQMYFSQLLDENLL